MDYAARLKHIESLPDIEALEVIESEATEVSQNETLDKLYSGALVAHVQTRYGDKTMQDIARTIGVSRSTVYERRDIVNFFNGFSACADYCQRYPAVRYSHLRTARRVGQHYHEDAQRARRTALLALRNALNDGMSTTEFDQYTKAKIFNKTPATIGNYTGLLIGIDERGAIIQLTAGDWQKLHAVQEDVLSISIRVMREETE